MLRGDSGDHGILNSSLPCRLKGIGTGAHAVNTAYRGAKVSHDQNIDDTDEVGYSYIGSNEVLKMGQNGERLEVRSTLSRIVSSFSKPSAITHQVPEWADYS